MTNQIVLVDCKDCGKTYNENNWNAGLNCCPTCHKQQLLEGARRAHSHRYDMFNRIRKATAREESRQQPSMPKFKCLEGME